MILIITAFASFLITLAFAFFFKKKVALTIVLFIPLSIVLEILLTKDVAGFVYRYYYHWIFLFSLLLVAPLGFFSKKYIKNKWIFILIIAWVVLFSKTAILNGINSTFFLNSSPVTELDKLKENYALGNSSIYDWIDFNFPTTRNIIRWCELQNPATKLFFINTEKLVLHEENGLHAFFLNCDYQELMPNGVSADEQAALIIKQHPGGYLFSIDKCEKGTKNPYNDQFYAPRYELSQKLICQSKEAIPNLYILPNQPLPIAK